MLASNQIYNISCQEGLRQLDTESIDFVCIDPPYTDGKNDVLSGHKIQTKLDILEITKEHYRVLKPNSFYAFFGQMPTILAWYNAAIECGFEFKEDITWVKRHQSSPFQVPLRVKELIFIFKKGKPKFYKTKGLYEDVKIPSISTGCLNIESLSRYISELWQMIENKKKSSRINTGERKCNDAIYSCFTDGVRAVRFTDFTNVWSFLPHNTSSLNNTESNVKHPTVKPTLVLERLIELCTPEDTEIIVLDSFIGSGSTYLAAQNTHRRCIGFEIEEEYYLLSKSRAEKNVDLFTIS